jgi:hypothetical protein
MKEFAAAVEAQKSATSRSANGTAPAPAADPVPKASHVVSESINMDKMAVEAAGIQTSQQEMSFEQAVGTSINEDRLVAEASKMQAGTDLKEQTQMLGQFEDFVKKNQP